MSDSGEKKKRSYPWLHKVWNVPFGWLNCATSKSSAWKVCELPSVMQEQEGLCTGSRHLRIFIEGASLTQHRQNVNELHLSAHTLRACTGSSPPLQGPFCKQPSRKLKAAWCQQQAALLSRSWPSVRLPPQWLLGQSRAPPLVGVQALSFGHTEPNTCP